MKTSVLTIRLNRELDEQLGTLGASHGTYPQPDRAQGAPLRRHLAVAQLDDLRRRVMPFAEAAGYLTGEDIFQNIS